ncbi:MAG TPA: TerC family protein [Planctomycetota bacterium]|nr:TerC family protein [Planctomycetota bacterium]
MPAFFQDTWSWTQIFKIVLLDLLLAGDNAIVIAMAVRLLPPREQRLGRFWGVFGAVALRILFLTIATWLLKIPWLQFVGGVLLLWIAYKLLSPEEHGVVAPHGTPAEGNEPKVRAGESLRQAIWIIVIADASMSLDNVIAVTGAAEGHLGLAIGGVALSIPLVVWGSQLLSKVMENHRWVVWLGGGVLGHVAGVLMLEENALRPWVDKVEHPGRHPLSLTLGAICFLFGWWASRHIKQRAAAPAKHDASAGTP